jgi:hypothetical protein
VLIDVSRKPLIVFPEECRSSVVVRSVGSKVATGIISRPPDKLGAKNTDLTPGASLRRGAMTCFETRLPLKSMYVPSKTHEEARARTHRLDDLVSVIEPFEVTSVYTDILTKVIGTWRVAVRVEFVSKMKRSPWLVGILDAWTGTLLSSIAVSEIDPDPFKADVLPLDKLVKQTLSPHTAWSRILEDDGDD